MSTCQCEKCVARGKKKACARVYREDLTSSEQARYSSPRFWCQCGAWKYDDAPCCEDCWEEQGAYSENR
jgi:hypothetical protein